MISSSIVLIGNGPAAAEGENGERIDSFDDVVRFNNYRIKDYEKALGTKSTVWITRVCETIEHHDPKEFDTIIGVINYCIYTPTIKALAPSFARKYPDMDFIYEDQVRGYSEQFGYDPYKNWLSVGMISILYLLDYFDVLHLHGFGGNTAKSYYGHTNVGVEFHRYDLETAKIADLAKKGRIKWLTDDEVSV